MSKYYSTVTTDKGVTTRAGNHYVTAAAQSWEGSVSVTLGTMDEKSEKMVEIRVGPGSTSCPSNSVLYVKLSDLLNGKKLKMVPVEDEDGNS
jgi:hypothetical protein